MIVKLANLIAIQRDRFNNKLSSDDIGTMFNQFLIEFERMEKSGTATTKIFLDGVEDIIDAVLSILPYKLLDPKVLNHPLMHFVHQLLITIVDNWCMSHLRVNIQETDIFLKIVLIFVHIAEQASIPNTDENEKTKKNLLTMKQLLFKVRQQIDDIVLNKQDLNNDPNIWAVGLLTIKLLEGSPFYYKMGNNQRLINDLIMNSLDSYNYQQVMRQLQHGQSLTDIEYYLFYTCWQCLSSKSLTEQNFWKQPSSIELIHYLVDELLTRLERTLDEPSTIAAPSIAYIFQRYRQLLNVHNLRSFDKHAHYIIDHLSHILQEQLSENPQDEPLITVALEAFHNLSKNIDIVTIMRKRQLNSLLKNYASTGKKEQRKLTFSILAETMDEQEINNNPSEIIANFIDQLKRLNPNEYNPDVDSTLSSLKVLMQYEQIKNEIIKQGGLEKLMAFIRDSDPKKQSSKQLEDALKILWSCTFNNPQVVNMFKQDTSLMIHVKQVLDNAKQDGNSELEKAAEGFIWKVEKEEQFKEQQAAEDERKKKEKKAKVQQTGVEEEEEEEEQYDLMISYSWADMDLAHRIFHHLTDKLGYKIWLDQEQMHGSTIQAMANAVDNAQFILICMSETYKRSANCQSEAEYAFNRKKHIVPCKMKKEYTADGWLGFILGSRMYIDFGKHEFEKAIELLDNEIQLQKKKRKEVKRVERSEMKTEVEVDEKNTDNVKQEAQSDHNEIEEKIDLVNILSWSESAVRAFFTKKDLLELLPICNGINGKELVDLYQMCRINSVSMYHSLKFELLTVHDKVLPISTYLHFIDRLRSVCDGRLPLNSCIYRKQLEDFLQDDE